MNAYDMDLEPIEISKREYRQLSKFEKTKNNGWVAIAAVVISAAASAYSAHQQKKAQEQAAQGASSSGDKQIDELRRQYDQLRADYEPFRQTGLTANERLNQLNKGDISGFQQSPGYQYALEQGLKAVNRQKSAQGALNTGAQQLELQRTGQGLAAQDYNNYVNQLLVQSGRGQAATGSVGAAGQQYAGNIGNVYQQQGQNALLAGQARASAYQGYNEAAQNALNQYMQYRGYQQGSGGGGYSGGYGNSTTSWGQ